MAHFAELDENNVVIRVIVVSDEDAVDGEQFCHNLLGGTWKQTSYNTHAGKHDLGGNPFRKNYASVGHTYDSDLDAFVPPRPYASWGLNNDTGTWEPPVPRPDTAGPKRYRWDDVAQQWVNDHV